jgi:nicotinate phosphoribosyltransferase
MSKLALLTDLYQLTMVYGYWKSGMAERKAAFHINFRKKPFNDNHAIVAGLETAIQFIEQELRFTESDLNYLASLDLFEEEFLHFLSRFSFACDVDAMQEGSLVFPYEPSFRVTGPIWQAQLLESPMLNLINFQTLIATKASRVCRAAHPNPVVEFGMRRAQGVDGAISASRAAFIGGCESTSNVIAGKLFGIPVRGTHAHSWIMAFDDEEISFSTFADVMPNHCIMLIDTYNSLEGAKKAIRVAKSKKDFFLTAVRIDSGDLGDISRKVREILDAEGFTKTQIMATSDLDEYEINKLKAQGAKIDVWGVGTNLVTSKDQPALDGVYKLAAVQNEKGEWIHKIKLSETPAKTTNPGILQVRRFDGGDCIFDELSGVGDIFFDYYDGSEIKISGAYQDMLVPIFRNGKRVYQSPSIKEMQELCKLQLSRFENNRFGLETSLYAKKMEMVKQLKH